MTKCRSSKTLVFVRGNEKSMIRRSTDALLVFFVDIPSCFIIFTSDYLCPVMYY